MRSLTAPEPGHHRPEISPDLQDVAQGIHQEFDDRLDPDAVDECVNRVAAKFNDAKVRSFTPLLVRRYVREELSVLIGGTELHRLARIKRRKLAGAIVTREIAHQGKTQEWAADRMGMASSSLHVVLNGEADVTATKLRTIAGALGLPRRLLTYIVDGDAAQIRAIGDDEIQPNLRRAILDGLVRIDAEGMQDATA